LNGTIKDFYLFEDNQMGLINHHFLSLSGNKIAAYWYEDRYRYTVSTDYGIEYRELCWLYPLKQSDLERLIHEDIWSNPYSEHQLKAKCIRCSKPFGAPRKEYNLAPICNRCYSAMEEANDTSLSDAHVFYEINPDGSKGSVIKQD
jgi:hypothetical protein